MLDWTEGAVDGKGGRMLSFLWVVLDIGCDGDYVVDVSVSDCFVIWDGDHEWSGLSKWFVSAVPVDGMAKMCVYWCLNDCWVPGVVAEDIVCQVDDGFADQREIVGPVCYSKR